jgi:hypothetical protein
MFIITHIFQYGGQDSSVGIAIRYGLDGPTIDPSEDNIFHTRPNWAWAPPSLPNDGYRFFPAGKPPRSGIDHPPLSRVEAKDRVKQYLYSPSEPSWSVLGWNLPLYLLLFPVFCKIRPVTDMADLHFPSLNMTSLTSFFYLYFRNTL